MIREKLLRKRYILLSYALIFFSLLLSSIVRFNLIGQFTIIIHAFSKMLPIFGLALLILTIFLKDSLTRVEKYRLNIVLFTVVFICIGLLTLEKGTFPNYLYSSIGIKPTDLMFLLILSITLLTLQNFKTMSSDIEAIFKPAVYNLFLIPILVMAIFAAGNSLNINNILSSPVFGYDALFPEEYSYLNAMSNNIPLRCLVIHPPRSKYWHSLGNQPFLRYFLFPRVLISGDLINEAILDHPKSTFCFISVNEDDEPSWPQIKEDQNFVNFNSDEFAYSKSWIHYSELRMIPDKTSSTVATYSIRFHE